MEAIEQASDVVQFTKIFLIPGPWEVSVCMCSAPFPWPSVDILAQSGRGSHLSHRLWHTG